jgi:hypothetical protein
MYVSHRRPIGRGLRRAAIFLPNRVKLSMVAHGAQDVPDIPVEPFGGSQYPSDMEAGSLC